MDATLAGPRGNAISGQRSDARTVFGDLYPQLTLKWNHEVHNFLAYATGNVPIGAYNPNRLANLGIGHGAMDAGGGYTYLNPKTGLEFSTVLGVTYNFENPDTKYKNGVNLHLDWGASYFIREQVHVGAVGYLYNQITDDSGLGAKLGGFRSRVAGLGPQVGYMFAVGERVKGYLNVKAYGEFAEQNRPAGWNAWVTLSFSLAEPHR
ncbi:SphA family protein [Dankookia sp. P2]|uniref:SphA family protein n=1 Tax=Dankookia sp. P2 TaxID=3423955 RepID=UPI003D66864F